MVDRGGVGADARRGPTRDFARCGAWAARLRIAGLPVRALAVALVVAAAWGGATSAATAGWTRPVSVGPAGEKIGRPQVVFTRDGRGIVSWTAAVLGAGRRSLEVATERGGGHWRRFARRRTRAWDHALAMGDRGAMWWLGDDGRLARGAVDRGLGPLRAVDPGHRVRVGEDEDDRGNVVEWPEHDPVAVSLNRRGYGLIAWSRADRGRRRGDFGVYMRRVSAGSRRNTRAERSLAWCARGSC